MPRLPDEKDWEEQEPFPPMSSKNSSRVEILSGSGWSVNANETTTGDVSSGESQKSPVDEQIENVKFYMKQAKAAGKIEELEILRQSLNDLIIWKKHSES